MDSDVHHGVITVQAEPSFQQKLESMDTGSRQLLLHLTHMDVGNAEDGMEPSPPCSRSPV